MLERHILRHARRLTGVQAQVFCRAKTAWLPQLPCRMDTIHMWDCLLNDVSTSLTFPEWMKQQTKTGTWNPSLCGLILCHLKIAREHAGVPHNAR